MREFHHLLAEVLFQHASSCFQFLLEMLVASIGIHQLLQLSALLGILRRPDVIRGDGRISQQPIQFLISFLDTCEFFQHLFTPVQGQSRKSAPLRKPHMYYNMACMEMARVCLMSLVSV